jgi:GAF domain-containing protein
VLNVISRSTSELQPVLDTIVATAARLCRAEWANIHKLEPDGKYHLAAATGSDQEFLRYLSQEPVVAGRGTMAGRTALEGRTLHIPDVLQDPEYTWSEAQAKGGHRTLLGVPLLRGGAVIGVIVLARNVVRPFKEKEIALVTTFADQAVIAIENVRLFTQLETRNAELKEALERETATADVLKVISRSTFDLQTVFDKLVESATRLCRADRANIARLNGEAIEFVAFSGFSLDYASYMRALSLRVDRGSISGRAVLEGTIVHIHDVLADSEFNMHEAQARGGFRTGIGAPLLREGTPIGVFFLARATVAPFTQQEIDVVERFADQAVIAIENARLLRELRESLQQQTATADVLKAISRATFDLPTVLKTLVEAAARLCQADQGTIAREQGGVFRRVASHGFSDEFNELISTLPVELERGSATGRALMEGRLIHIPDVESDSEYTFVEAKGAGRLSHGPCRAHVARGRRDRRSGLDAHRGASVHRKGDRARRHLCRPGRHRHRERAAVRERRGALARAGAIARGAAHCAGSPRADREARLARAADCRHCA